MTPYARACIASIAVSVGTVGLLLWSASGDRDPTYVYVSLAAPTLALSHHLLYFVGPFSSLNPPTYTFVSFTDEADATPVSTRRISRLYQRYLKRWKYVLWTVPDESNAMASSVLSIIVLILLAVLIGALGLSAGSVALLDSLDGASLTRWVRRLVKASCRTKNVRLTATQRPKH